MAKKSDKVKELARKLKKQELEEPKDDEVPEIEPKEEKEEPEKIRINPLVDEGIYRTEIVRVLYALNTSLEKISVSLEKLEEYLIGDKE